VESLRFRNVRALGLGKPVYAQGRLFLGLEFPLGHNQQNDGMVTLRHLPGKTLQPGESLVTKTAVVGTASGEETAEEAFDRYIRRIAVRKPEVLTVYGNWARYDYLSDGIWPDEKMVLETVDQLAKMREAGWRPDYYVMDAGWFDPKGDYTNYIKPALADRSRRHGEGDPPPRHQIRPVVRRRRRDPRQPRHAAQQEARRQAVPGTGAVHLHVQEA